MLIIKRDVLDRGDEDLVAYLISKTVYDVVYFIESPTPKVIRSRRNGHKR